MRQFLSSKKKPLPLIELQKLWKGLFYSMWFSDMPRPQQRLAKKLGLLFLETIPLNSFIPFVELFWSIMVKEWSGIDVWRVDKFYMLIRRVLFYCFERLKLEKWDEKLIKLYLELLQKIPLSGETRVPVAIPYHLVDIYVDEIERCMFEEVELELELKELSEELKDEIIESTPIDLLLTPFKELQQHALLKTLRLKIKEDIFKDSRLVEWGIVELELEKVEAEAEGSDEEEEEWTGFA